MGKKIAGIICLTGMLAVSGCGAPGLAAWLAALAQSHPAAFGLVAVLISLLAGIALTALEQAAKAVFRRKLAVVAGK